MLNEIKKILNYYIWSSYRRKCLDKLLNKYSDLYHGIVLDIGGRDRGNFRKPKDKVKKWIFADINKEHSPDMILDVSNMEQVESESMDVVTAIELFEHVEKPEDGIRECHRVLKTGGHFIISAPFLYPIHGDPFDYQRWTENKWRKILVETGFKIEKIEPMGGFFTILSDMLKTLNKNIPIPFRQLFYILYPLLSAMTLLDNVKIDFLKNYTSGYFIITKK